MTDDVRIATALRHHRKTKRLRKLLGGDGCWSLVCLFLFAGEQRWTGDLGGMSDDDIEDEACWEGTRGAFVAACLEVRFLTGDDRARQIHDWHEHNPFAAGKGARIAASKRANESRWAAKRASQLDAGSVPNGSEPDPNRIRTVSEPDAGRSEAESPPAPAPAPSPAQPPNSDSPPDARGTFEPRVVGGGLPAGVSLAGQATVALRRAGVDVQSQNPDLLRGLDGGLTVVHLVELAASYPKKPIKYLVNAGLRQLAERAADVAAGGTAIAVAGAPRAAAPSKQAGAIGRLLHRGGDDDSAMV